MFQCGEHGQHGHACLKATELRANAVEEMNSDAPTHVKAALRALTAELKADAAALVAAVKASGKERGEALMEEAEHRVRAAFARAAAAEKVEATVVGAERLASSGEGTAQTGSTGSTGSGWVERRRRKARLKAEVAELTADSMELRGLLEEMGGAQVGRKDAIRSIAQLSKKKPRVRVCLGCGGYVVLNSRRQRRQS